MVNLKWSTCKVELNDATKDMNQHKLEWFSMEQKLANNEENTVNLKDQIRVKGEISDESER